MPVNPGRGGGGTDIFPQTLSGVPSAASLTTANSPTLVDLPLPVPGLKLTGIGQGGDLWRRAVQARPGITTGIARIRFAGLNNGYQQSAYLWRYAATGAMIWIGFGGNPGLASDFTLTFASSATDTAAAVGRSFSNSVVPAAAGFPYTVKMTLTGGIIHAYVSTDGVNFVEIGNVAETTIFGLGNHADQDGIGTNAAVGATTWETGMICDNWVSS